MTTPRSARGNGAGSRNGERERLAASIAGTRDELARTLNELQLAVREHLQWREWVRRRPLLALGFALMLGYRLGRSRWR